MTREAWNPEASQVIAWIERSVGPGAYVVRVDALPASATEKHLVQVALRDGSTLQLVLRRYHDAERLMLDPWYQPANEAMALRLLTGTRVPAPRLYAADLEAVVCDVPALLESWVPGGPAWAPDDLDGYLARAAEVLVAIHAVSVPSDVKLPQYVPYRVGPPHSTRSGVWERAFRVLEAPQPPHRKTFIHRDYHPGNVLWDGAQVCVVDWATAAWGPPGIDLARMPLNLAAHLGRNVAERFLVAYLSAGGDPSARDPFWDLLDAVDVLPDLVSPMWLGGGNLAQLELYVESVLAEA